MGQALQPLCWIKNESDMVTPTVGHDPTMELGD